MVRRCVYSHFLCDLSDDPVFRRHSSLHQTRKWTCRSPPSSPSPPLSSFTFLISLKPVKSFFAWVRWKLLSMQCVTRWSPSQRTYYYFRETTEINLLSTDFLVERWRTEKALSSLFEISFCRVVFLFLIWRWEYYSRLGQGDAVDGF